MLKNKLSKRIPTVLAAAVLPLKLFAMGDHFYVGVNGMVNYIPEDDFKYSTWEVTNNSNTYSLTGKTFKNKSKYGFSGSVAGGRMFENYMQFEVEAGVDMSAKLKAKNNPITPLSSHAAGAGVAGDENMLTKDSVVIDQEMLKTNVFYGLVNAYFNFDMQGSFMPFVGVGAGVAHYKLDFDESSFGTKTELFSNNLISAKLSNYELDKIMQETDKNSIIFQASAGANMMVGDSFLLGAGYRFLSSPGEIDTEQDKDSSGGSSSNKVKHHYMRHNLIVNAKFLM
ncbi:exported hypothetical protein [Candidatus Xenohaliotis californiensis]|uniref:Outer membrane protein beta-barrel domain-containing protein n=1 Tax=Candidatus Xenohaliotis californiensis TaxID=84677 RepID=A0ABM9N706_9RICK|nr:exported hypothetical protein [Candidatus Xenohaliotis californiensis]